MYEGINAIADIGSDTIVACDSTLISTNPITNGSYLWNTSNASTSGNLAIGDTYQGGLIFYLDGSLFNSIYTWQISHGYFCV